MFTGIIEQLATIESIQHEGTNIHFTINSSLAQELKVDQSVAHNGVCLTVVRKHGNAYTVTAIQETLELTALQEWKVGQLLNIERCTAIGHRLDGHIVQGHVDAVGKCLKIEEADGSWYFTFQYPSEFAHLIVSKGSITVNGTSLTVVEPTMDTFQVAIIPYTYENTVFHSLKNGDQVNLEFDIIGKYVARMEAVQNYRNVNG